MALSKIRLDILAKEKGCWLFITIVCGSSTASAKSLSCRHSSTLEDCTEHFENCPVAQHPNPSVQPTLSVLIKA
ncbi:hypothetical protein Tdes44962_MAKER06593 [Teratosphaeria destructans]|uniref:Uncharacterized protein n=1 Tax=Teratosphaeria destructans TaxID=418781 RepID=A0A9W7T1C7_9PEZI|nr:hypothetical protein Tdes44962_MAKER06593 [Teratosphaeria destructans]